MYAGAEAALADDVVYVGGEVGAARAEARMARSEMDRKSMVAVGGLRLRSLDVNECDARDAQ